MTHTESVDEHPSIHYISPYKSHSIKTAAVQLDTSVPYKQNSKKPVLIFYFLRW